MHLFYMNILIFNFWCYLKLKIKILIYKTRIFLFILYKYITMHGAKSIKLYYEID